jgi:hypothetical protein
MSKKRMIDYTWAELREKSAAPLLAVLPVAASNSTVCNAPLGTDLFIAEPPRPLWILTAPFCCRAVPVASQNTIVILRSLW